MWRKLVFMKNDGYFYKNKIFVMTQNFAFRKLNLIKKLTELQNEDLFEVLEQLLNVEDEGDWGKGLTEKDRVNIEQGLKDIEEGKTITLEEFNEQMKKKFK